jgi:hypothetical protein
MTVSDGFDEVMSGLFADNEEVARAVLAKR